MYRGKMGKVLFIPEGQINLYCKGAGMVLKISSYLNG
jgi:hypothetical protein